MSLSSTNCYFITERKNASHRFFPKWKETIVISLQTSSLSPCLPTSNTLTTNFFVEQSLMASMLIKHLPFSLPSKDHQTALREPHSILCCCTFNPSVYIQVFSLSTTWEGQPVFGILILYSYSNIEAIINHSTSMNNRNKINCTNDGEKRKKIMLRNKNTQNNIALLSKLVAFKTAACWIYTVSCGVRHQAF